MPRPRRHRNIRGRPNSNYFKPAGIPLQQLETIELTLEEFEAIRLLDREQLNQQEAAELMHISQATLSRTITSARKKVADAFAEGKAISIGDNTTKI